MAVNMLTFEGVQEEGARWVVTTTAHQRSVYGRIAVDAAMAAGAVGADVDAAVTPAFRPLTAVLSGP